MNCRLRSLKQCYAAIKESDPGTSLTPCAIKRLALSGKIPVVRIGVKVLINLDGLLEILSNATAVEIQEEQQLGIRKVDIKQDLTLKDRGRDR